MDQRLKELITRVYEEIAVEGINPVLKKSRLKKYYDEYINKDNS